MTPSRDREAGLTLIEVMVSLLLAMMLTGGLFAMMSGQQRTYQAQINQLTSQSNLWGAMEYLQSEIRKAGMGFGSCAGQLKATSGSGPLTLLAIDVRNNFNLLTGAADTAGSDSFRVRYSQTPPGQLMGMTLQSELPAVNVLVNSLANVQDGDYLVVSTPGSTMPCALLQATCNGNQCRSWGPGQWRIAVNPSNSGPYRNPQPNYNQYISDLGLPASFSGYPTGSVMYNMGALNGAPRNFAIDRSRDPPMLVTWLGETATPTPASSLEVVAEGIEDLQISYACDQDLDGTLEEGPTLLTADEWNYNVSGDTVQPCSDANGAIPIGAVRITLIARSTSGVPGDKLGFRPAAEDHAAGTPAQDLAATGNVGTYKRAALTSVVQPRNLQ